MITEETIARMKQNLEVKNEFFVLDVIKHLEAHIEKMKCCMNCKWYRVENGGETFCDCVGDCIDFDKWELAE